MTCKSLESGPQIRSRVDKPDYRAELQYEVQRYEKEFSKGAQHDAVKDVGVEKAGDSPPLQCSPIDDSCDQPNQYHGDHHADKAQVQVRPIHAVSICA